MGRGRPKGAKNKNSVNIKSDKVYPVRLELDLEEWVSTMPNKNKYFNDIVRKDMEEQLKKEE